MLLLFFVPIIFIYVISLEFFWGMGGVIGFLFLVLFLARISSILIPSKSHVSSVTKYNLPRHQSTHKYLFIYCPCSMEANHAIVHASFYLPLFQPCYDIALILSHKTNYLWLTHTMFSLIEFARSSYDYEKQWK